MGTVGSSSSANSWGSRTHVFGTKNELEIQIDALALHMANLIRSNPRDGSGKGRSALADGYFDNQEIPSGYGCRMQTREVLAPISSLIVEVFWQVLNTFIPRANPLISTICDTTLSSYPVNPKCTRLTSVSGQCTGPCEFNNLLVYNPPG